MRTFPLEQIQDLYERVLRDSPFYQKKYRDYRSGALHSYEDFLHLPFTEKNDLRAAYPLGLAAVPEEKIVRIHSSSGTTGTPVIIPYSRKDVDDWAEIFVRCYETCHVTPLDRVQVTPGYGLWTAGIGFQAGAEKLGAMVIPMGPGNTEKQLAMMQDMKSTVLCATSSYALYIAEAIAAKGLQDRLHLKRALIGSERWGPQMRRKISELLGAKLYDIYGLTEIYGPGIGISCDAQSGMHYWDDYIYCEIIDPHTGEVLPEGEIGELVITTLQKEAAPLIRYRTRDLTRFVPGACPCGRKYPRIDTLIGRSDDMVKVKGVNIFPKQIEECIHDVPGSAGEYQVIVDHLFGRDQMTVFFECEAETDRGGAEAELRQLIKNRIGLTVQPKAVELGDLPRSEKKTTRVFDNRY